MPILRATDIGLAFGPQVLLDNASFQLRKGDRVCLVGRNGAGKSTLMKLVEGKIQPDSGSIWRAPTVRIARLAQELPKADQNTVSQVVAGGLVEVGQLLNDYNALASRSLDSAGLKQLDALQHEIEAKDGWRLQQKVDEVITRLSLPKDTPMIQLSGGWRKRVALATALVNEPDILLLDEPTNHLDIQTIQWLEKQLLEFSGALLFITHDRALVQALATNIVELDRGTLRSYHGDYQNYLDERERLLDIEEQQNALFDKRLAQEEQWIRQGIKARRTRNEGRVRALQKLREERSARRQKQGNATIAIEAARTSGKLVAELSDISVELDGQLILNHVSFNVLRGDKIGLLGPNGVGKTTLLKVLLGELAPSSGKVKLGTQLEVAYYDQMRDRLDDEKTIVDTVGQGRDSVTINGRTRHIMSYLSDFLFSAERARTPLKALSGGERNRVQLACLFSTAANILVLDEPTNDLDVETLELLEAALVEFSGTVLLVSHDRHFMDNVVTGTLAFEGGGKVSEYVGGYHDWLRQSGEFVVAETAGKMSKKDKTTSTNQTQKSSKKHKLDYKSKRELDQLPDLIDSLEQQQATLHEEVSAADFYQQEQSLIKQRLNALEQVSNELETAYQRWMELADSA